MRSPAGWIGGRTAGWFLGTVLAGATLTGCGGEPVDLSRLQAQGVAGETALALMEAHGGVDNFRRLLDLDYTVQVERFDSSGQLLDTTQELHRFQAAPPHRYLVRRTTRRVLELGLFDDRAWVRIDGGVQSQSGIETEVRQELALLAMLNRAPFCLADPSLGLVALPDLAAPPDGGPGYRRLAAELVASEGEKPLRFVFLINADTGLLHRVVFEAHGPPGSPPLRIAQVGETLTVDDVTLVSRWVLLPADQAGHEIDAHDVSWTVKQHRADNGFTDELYRVGAAGS